jgi:hypothetical protein
MVVFTWASIMVEPNRFVLAPGSLKVASFHHYLLCLPALKNKSKKRKYRLGNLIRSSKVSNAGKGTPVTAQVIINSFTPKQNG